MSINQYNEDSYEQTLISLFKQMGYQYECGYDVERDFREPYYAEDLRKGLRRQNPMLSVHRRDGSVCVKRKYKQNNNNAMKQLKFWSIRMLTAT